MAGQFCEQLSVDPAPGGSFGPAARTAENTTAFAAVDDNMASLLVRTLDAVD